MRIDKDFKDWPETYLHVEECRSGECWIMPISGRMTLDLERLVKRWVKEEYGGELRLDPPIIPKLDGDYYGKIMTDGRSPDSVICWDGGGFYLKQAYEY